MKTIILIRHAKSSWKFPDLKDVERPLKKRGTTDAALMANVLKDMQVRPDKIISSPAVRALATAKAFAGQAGFDDADILVDPRLYLESKTKLSQLVTGLDDAFQTIALVSHNPGITDFANFLANDTIENIPTSGIVGIQFDCNSWSEIEKGKGKQLFFEIPKKHRKKIEKAETKIL
jgi:phosphohistidine phosphatase